MASHLNTANSCLYVSSITTFGSKVPCRVYSNKIILSHVCGNLIWTYTQICGKVMDSDNVKKEK